MTAQSQGIPVCVTVSHVDGLVVARSGFHSSINYRSVMAFGLASVIEDEDHKRRAMDTYIDRFFPGRATSNRAATSKELQATKLLSMDIDEASAKIRIGQPIDDEEDYALPIWAGVINFKTMIADTILIRRISRAWRFRPELQPMSRDTNSTRHSLRFTTATLPHPTTDAWSGRF